jgi:hypothetical protein
MAKEQLDENGNKVYDMTCEECRGLQKEMIESDRKHWKVEIEKMLDEKLSTHINIVKTQKNHSNWLLALTIAIIIVVFYLIIEK